MDVMTSPLLTAVPEETAEIARERMRLKRIHHLAVIERGELVGVVSARDLAGARRSQTVGELMTRDVATGTPGMKLREAANLLRGHVIGCLPVLDRGKPVGIVTVSDVLELVGRGVERPVARSTRWTMKDRGSGRKAKRTRALAEASVPGRR
jgi:CBS domain-containing protein